METSPNNGNVLESGEFAFRVRRSDGSETTHVIDVLCLKMVCEETELAHNLQTDQNDCYKPTSAFLMDLASRLAVLGVENCTPSLAFQLWNVAGKKIQELKKNVS